MLRSLLMLLVSGMGLCGATCMQIQWKEHYPSSKPSRSRRVTSPHWSSSGWPPTSGPLDQPLDVRKSDSNQERRSKPETKSALLDLAPLSPTPTLTLHLYLVSGCVGLCGGGGGALPL